MADPLTLAVVAGTQMLQGFMAKQQADAQADIQMANARQEELVGAQREATVRRRNRRAMAQGRAIAASSGFTSEGTFIDVLASNAAELELEALNARFDAQSAARAQRTAAKQSKARGRTALVSSFLSAAGTAAGGMGGSGGSAGSFFSGSGGSGSFNLTNTTKT